MLSTLASSSKQMTRSDCCLKIIRQVAFTALPIENDDNDNTRLLLFFINLSHFHKIINCGEQDKESTNEIK